MFCRALKYWNRASYHWQSLHPKVSVELRVARVWQSRNFGRSLGKHLKNGPHAAEYDTVAEGFRKAMPSATVRPTTRSVESI